MSLDAPGRSILKAIEHLVGHGWVSLRQMAILLGYNELRGIYQRQRGKNRIDTVKVGGVARVYAETARKLLEDAVTKEKPGAVTILAWYKYKLTDHLEKEHA